MTESGKKVFIEWLGWLAGSWLVVIDQPPAPRPQSAEPSAVSARIRTRSSPETHSPPATEIVNLP